jgi:hypothetical protein
MKKLMRALVGGIGAAGSVGKGLFGKLKDDEEEKKKGTVTPASTTPAATMEKGGYVKAADGCAKKGKTKGRMV